jgi:hypothetical protein
MSINRLWSIFHEGEEIGVTELNPTIDRIAVRDKISVVLNRAASWPRYDATGRRNGQLCLACAGDPNLAILDCSSQVRGRASYLGH